MRSQADRLSTPTIAARDRQSTGDRILQWQWKWSPEDRSIAELEKQTILNAITELNGDKLQAARLLGIGKTTLYRKLKDYAAEGLSTN